MNFSTRFSVEELEFAQWVFAHKAVKPWSSFFCFASCSFLCWPLALAALVLYPLVWLVLLPFRVVGIAVGGALELVKAIFFLPVRVLRAI